MNLNFLEMKITRGETIIFQHNNEHRTGKIFGSYLIDTITKIIIKTTDGNTLIINESDIINKQ